MFERVLQRVSAAPTNPAPREQVEGFDVADLYRGPVDTGDQAEVAQSSLDEKLRQAYFWIVNTAIISPHYDIEFNDAPPSSWEIGDGRRRFTLPSAQSYSSFVLLPLLTFATRRKCLFIGGPGRGKTATAILMGVLAGYPVREVRRAMQHGHPQLTIADLFGNPLPADLLKAERIEDIRIAWRSWLGMRVKIVDEYNRIPTRTQSALLTVMGDNYAELLGHVYECPEAAWFLTANDESGGGTYQVIEALRDRIDVIVQALSFNPRFLEDLLIRVEERVRPEEAVPPALIFTAAELDLVDQQIRRVVLPAAVRRRIEFFASQFELLDVAADQLEYRTKDTARLTGADWRTLVAADSGRDRLQDLGCQSVNGLSVRVLLTLLMYSKALAHFRGHQIVHLDDVRQILPFVLRDKLQPDLAAPFFDAPGNAIFRTDRIGWLRQLFDASCGEYDRLDLDRDDPLVALNGEMRRGLEGVPAAEVRARIVAIERLVAEWSHGRKLYGTLADDLLNLKYLHQRYSSYLRWLESA